VTEHLYIVQIGPVQSFIAQARRTQDLLVGSKMLSHLAGKGWEVASNSNGFKPIYPIIKSDSSPHKFAFISAEADPQKLANEIYSAIIQSWSNNFAEPIYREILNAVGEGEWQDTFMEQHDKWLEFYWIAQPYDATNHSKSHKNAGSALAQRKLVRNFYSVSNAGAKCTLTGAQSALNLNWDTLRHYLSNNYAVNGEIVIRGNERLGTLALIKRLAPYIFDSEYMSRFPSTDAIAKNVEKEEEVKDQNADAPLYFAILHMDGDKMGKKLAKIRDIAQHQEFSEKLGVFAEETVPAIIGEFGGKAGRLIYSGGDDVLAFLPLSCVLECANRISEAFKEIKIQGVLQFTMSAGISITPSNLPLDTALEIARESEKKAKKQYGRDAIVISEAHGSQQRFAGAKWGYINELMPLAIELFQKGDVSMNFPYELFSIAHDMAGDLPIKKDIEDDKKKFSNDDYNKKMKLAMIRKNLNEAREAELGRILNRRSEQGTKDQEKTDTLTKFKKKILYLAEKYTWTDVANWLILARFFAEQHKREGESVS
jgi:CRISPR-associated protein Cmr2